MGEKVLGEIMEVELEPDPTK